MRILVTGSSGTIGTRLCEKLLEAGNDVQGIDWVPNKWQPSVQAITTLIDLRNAASLTSHISHLNADLIVHLAANARVYELVEDPGRARDNLLTLFNTLELARMLHTPRFIFASSRESYGNTDAPSYTEDMVRVEHCESPYTASKIGGEAMVHAYTRCYELEHIIFRFSNVYGMYDDSERIVPQFIRHAKNNEPLMIFGEEKCLDFTFIDDCVSGILSSINRWETAKNGTFNIAYGEGTTLVHLARRVKELLHSSSPIVLAQSRTGEITRYVADISQARSVLGYDPQTPFDRGIEQAVEWYAEQ